MKTPLLNLWRVALVAFSLSGLAFQPAQAHGGPWRGGSSYHHHGGGGARWVAPALIGGAVLGAVLTRPSYAYPVTPAPVYPVTPMWAPNVVPYAAPVVTQPVGYFCPTSGQFYPYVATCNVPWQLL